MGAGCWDCCTDKSSPERGGGPFAGWWRGTGPTAQAHGEAPRGQYLSTPAARRSSSPFRGGFAQYPRCKLGSQAGTRPCRARFYARPPRLFARCRAYTARPRTRAGLGAGRTSRSADHWKTATFRWTGWSRRTAWGDSGQIARLAGSRFARQQDCRDPPGASTARRGRCSLLGTQKSALISHIAHGAAIYGRPAPEPSSLRRPACRECRRRGHGGPWSGFRLLHRSG